MIKNGISSQIFFLILTILLSYNLEAQVSFNNLNIDTLCPLNSKSIYYENGKLKGSGPIDSIGKPTNKWCYWDEDGKLNLINYYDVEGMDSLNIYFSEKGKPLDFYYMEKGKIKYHVSYYGNGIMSYFSHYYCDSIIEKIYFFKNGIISQIVAETVPIKPVVRFYNKRTIKQIEFDESGIIKRSEP